MLGNVQAVLFATASLTLVGQIDAHGWIKVPQNEVLPGKSIAEWIKILQPAWPWVGAGSWKGGDQAGQFATLSKKNGFTTLRSFLDDKGDKCGNSNINVKAKDIPADGKVIFQGTQNTGFTHQGPCELWLDDTRVFHDDNCEKNYAGKGFTQSTIPVDFSSCKSTGCTLRFFWLGFQNEQWQVYKNCIPLKGGKGTGSTPATTKASSSPATAKPTTAPATKKPTSAPVTTKPTTAPATKKPTSAPVTTKPAPTTAKPASAAKPTPATPKPASTPAPSKAAAATEAPAANEAKKCIRRRRQ